MIFREANKFTRANAGGLRHLPIRTRRAARIAQFRRWVTGAKTFIRTGGQKLCYESA
jgi:hypothetical protein